MASAEPTVAGTVQRKNDELNCKTNTFNLIRFFPLPFREVFPALDWVHSGFVLVYLNRRARMHTRKSIEISRENLLLRSSLSNARQKHSIWGWKKAAKSARAASLRISSSSTSNPCRSIGFSSLSTTPSASQRRERGPMMFIFPMFLYLFTFSWFCMISISLFFSPTDGDSVPTGIGRAVASGVCLESQYDRVALRLVYD